MRRVVPPCCRVTQSHPSGSLGRHASARIACGCAGPVHRGGAARYRSQFQVAAKPADGNSRDRAESAAPPWRASQSRAFVTCLHVIFGRSRVPGPDHCIPCVRASVNPTASRLFARVSPSRAGGRYGVTSHRHREEPGSLDASSRWPRCHNEGSTRTATTVRRSAPPRPAGVRGLIKSCNRRDGARCPFPRAVACGVRPADGRTAEK